MKCIRLILSICCIAALTGCGLMPRKEVEIQYKNVLVEPPDSLIQDCKVAEPPNREEYIAATPEKREELLSKAFATSTTNVTVCNKQQKNLRDWKAEQRKIFATPTGAIAEKK